MRTCNAESKRGSSKGSNFKKTTVIILRMVDIIDKLYTQIGKEFRLP